MFNASCEFVLFFPTDLDTKQGDVADKYMDENRVHLIQGYLAQKKTPID